MGPSLSLGQLLGFLLTGHDFTNPTQERAAPVASPASLCGWASALFPALAPAFLPAAGLAPPSPAWPHQPRGGQAGPGRSMGDSHPQHRPTLYPTPFTVPTPSNPGHPAPPPSRARPWAAPWQRLTAPDCKFPLMGSSLPIKTVCSLSRQL